MSKLDTTQLTYVPEDDIDCWEKYPKHKWTYESGRLFDSQHIKWSPYETEIFNQRMLSIQLSSNKPLVRQPGFIWIKDTIGSELMTEVYIIRGEIKHMHHVHNQVVLETLNGDIELRLSAFVSLYFKKFTGVISVKTISNEIHKISLRPHRDLSEEKNSDIIKLLKRIYKKTDISINGPEDQAISILLTS
jgi:hypothetical protein